MENIFFDRAEVSRGTNGAIVVVLQQSGTGGREPTPVGILSCREAGALALLYALTRVLRG